MKKNTTGIPKLISCMTAFPYSVRMSDTIEEALALMRKHGIRHLGVREENSDDISRIISLRDIEQAQGFGKTHTQGDLSVAQLCPAKAIFADVNAPLDEALGAMTEHKIGSVLITRNKKVVGIFTATDACRLFAKHLQEEHGQGAPIPDILA